MTKIQAQAGQSLADIYDIKGSIAGIDDLETRELGIIHEMGATVFSERYGQIVNRSSTGAIAQNITWDNVLTNLATAPNRLLAMVVYADAGARVLRAQVSIRSGFQSREVPVWIYDGTNFIATRLDDNGTLGVSDVLLPNVQQTQLPNMMGGSGQPGTNVASEIAFRGTTTGFGAGTVTVTMMALGAFADLGGVSSYGLPIPSW